MYFLTRYGSEIKSDAKVFDLSNWEDSVSITEIGKVVGRGVLVER